MESFKQSDYVMLLIAFASYFVVSSMKKRCNMPDKWILSLLMSACGYVI